MPSKTTTHSLERQLRLKELEVKSILEITEAINDKLPVKNLEKIFEFILQAQIGINKMALFNKGENWECVSHYGCDLSLDIQLTKKLLLDFKKAQSLKSVIHPFLKQFEYILPIKRKKRLQSYW